MINTLWQHDDMVSYIDEFADLYKNKPISNNTGGMKFPHMFLMWYLVKKIKPKFLIESGVWKGLGTWFIEKASPDTKLFCIDPNPYYRIYTSKNAEYYTEDFSTLTLDLDPTNTLVFFDDHQNALERLIQSKNKNFSKLIFEDNYPYDQGDCYSLKKILSGNNFIMDYAGNRQKYDANSEHKNYLLNNIKLYQEMPPMYTGKTTRWNTLWEDYNTPKPLLNDESVKKYYDVSGEFNDYTWLCYVEI